MEWNLISKYFSDNPTYITRHHLDSYNEFVKKRLPNAINAINPISVVKNDEYKHTIDVYVGGLEGNKIFIAKPIIRIEDGTMPLYPNDARVKDMYYSADVYADVLVRYDGNIDKTFHQVRIGTIPIMVNSCICVTYNQPPDVRRAMGECPYDQGGYFIVDGLEKCLIGQERLAYNRALITKDEHPNSLKLLIETINESDPFSKSQELLLREKTDQIYVKISSQVGIESQIEVPLFIVFRALGVESDRQIMDFIAMGDKEIMNFLYPSCLNNENIYRKEDALEFLAQNVRYKSPDHVTHILVKDFLRNITSDFRKKCMFLGMLTRDLIKTHLRHIPLANKDNFSHKRIDISGELVFAIFRDYYNKLRAHIRKEIEYAYSLSPSNNISELIKDSQVDKFFDASIIDNGFRTSLKGKWGVDQDDGIVQDLSRISYVAYLSQMRRMNNPLDRSLKLAQPRRLDCSQWGVACPTQSPDGHNLGLDKNMTVLSTISTTVSTSVMREVLQDLKCIPIEDIGIIHKKTFVLLNNDLYGVVDDPDAFVQGFRLLRRYGAINAFCSIAWNRMQGKIYVFSESGRLLRPLLVVQGGKMVITENDLSKKWNTLFSGNERDLYDETYIRDVKEVIAPMEYIDVEEANNIRIAMTPSEITQNSTHCEIHPSTILSLYTNTIPFAHHNQAPRNVFSCAMGKQAIGVYSTNFNNRMEVMSYLLHYPQQPLVTTKYTKYTNIDKLPNGENPIVAVACYSGYNIEDSIIVNRQSIERGMFNVTYLKSFSESESDEKESKAFFANPYDLARKAVKIKTNYANELTIDESGLPKLNAYIEETDALLGKVVTKPTDNKSIVYVDASKIADKTVEGIVDKVLIFRNSKDDRAVKVRLRQTRLPQLGDKLASRHGQKGVIGMILNNEDMPFTKDGVVPDIIINPHALPTRMTVAHLLECICAKAGTLNCTHYDATTFESHDIFKYADDLAKCGYERYGNEIMYNGKTGVMMPCEIFIGPTYYFRLKHMVADKINYRNDGPVSSLTRQPIRGRANNGGLRVGEMERDSIIAHGMGSFLKECFVEKSDGFEVMYNTERGSISELNTGDMQGRMLMPYSMKLLLQEVEALGITIKMSEKVIDDEVTSLLEEVN